MEIDTNREPISNFLLVFAYVLPLQRYNNSLVNSLHFFAIYTRFSLD